MLRIPAIKDQVHADTGPLGLALLGFGAALGILDVAINTHGVAVQDRLGRPVMSSLHGMFSVGGLLGSLAAGGAGAGGLSPLVNFALVAAVLGGAAFAASAWLLPASCDVTPEAAQGGWASLPAGLRRPLVLLGFVGLCGMMMEGAIGDWGAIYLHSDLGTSAALAALGYSAYSIAMTVGRFLGDRCVARWARCEWSRGR